MREKRVVALFLSIFLLVLLVSSVSALWPFDSGKKMTTITGNAISYSAQLPLCIGYELGANGCTDGHAFNGYIDEVVVYNRALTNEEAIGLFGLNVPTNGRAAYWNFDSSSTPTLQNNARVVIDPAGSALDLVLQLDGTNQFAQVPYSATLQPGEAISFSAWFKSNDYTKSQRILSAVQGGGYGLVLNDPYGTCRTDTLCAIVRVGSSYLTAQVARSQLPSTTYGNWYQAVGVYDGTTLKLYVNGRQVDPAPATITTVQRGAECDSVTKQNTRTCASGLTCQDTNGDGVGACRSSQGGQCSNTNECLSGYGLTCTNSVCVTSSTSVTVSLGQECNMREVPNKKVCASDATCQDTNDDGIGACRHAAGLSCARDSDCFQGTSSPLKCLNSVCTSQSTTTTTTTTTGKGLGEVCTSNSECTNNNCYGNICTQFSSFEGSCDSRTNQQGAGFYGMTCQPGTGLSCVSTDCICTGQTVWSNTENRCVASQLSSNYITDISARGYVGEGLRTLILGFNTTSSAELTATIDSSWTAPQALLPESITTNLYLVSSGATVADSDTSSYAIKSPVSSGVYGLAASAPGTGGQAVLATTGSNVKFAQFSARGYADANTPLILGFTVRGDYVNADIQAHPEKLPAEFTPKLTDFTYDIILYDASNTQLYSSKNTIGPRLGPGRYTVVVQPEANAGGYMLLEIADLNAGQSSTSTSTQTSTTTQTNSPADVASQQTTTQTTTANTQTTVTTTGNAAVQCTNGCIQENICYPAGQRREGKYCDGSSRTFVAQNGADATCANNFECSSNVCLENKCISSNLLQRLLEYLKGLFGNG